MQAPASRDPVLPAPRGSWGVLVLAAVLVVFLGLYVLTRPASVQFLLVVSNDTGQSMSAHVCPERACTGGLLGTLAPHTQRGFPVQGSRPVVVVLGEAGTVRCGTVLPTSGSVVIRASQLHGCEAFAPGGAVRSTTASTPQAGHGVPTSKNQGHP